MNQLNLQLNSGAPNKELHRCWQEQLKSYKKLNPDQASSYRAIVVGTGLAGASASATLAEMGFNVKAFSYHESPRRAHSIAAQGGINAAKNYKKDGDSTMRLFYEDRKSTRLNSSHVRTSRMPSSA